MSVDFTPGPGPAADPDTHKGPKLTTALILGALACGLIGGAWWLHAHGLI